MTIKLEKMHINGAQSDENTTLPQIFQYNNPLEKSNKQYYSGICHEICLDSIVISVNRHKCRAVTRRTQTNTIHIEYLFR